MDNYFTSIVNRATHSRCYHANAGNGLHQRRWLAHPTPREQGREHRSCPRFADPCQSQEVINRNYNTLIDMDLNHHKCSR